MSSPIVDALRLAIRLHEEGRSDQAYRQTRRALGYAECAVRRRADEHFERKRKEARARRQKKKRQRRKKKRGA